MAVAGTGLRCSLSTCTYSTDDQVPAESALETKVTLLRIHADTVHPPSPSPVQQNPATAGSRAKLDPPKLSAGADQQTWDLFQRSWQLYKSGMAISAPQQAVHLFNCLDEDLRGDVLRANPDKDISTVAEAELLESIKSLAVKVESKLVHRIKMGQTVQSTGHSIRNFHATLKGYAKLCQYKIKCSGCAKEIDYSDEMILDQLVRGISDKEILEY